MIGRQMGKVFAIVAKRNDYSEGIAGRLRGMLAERGWREDAEIPGVVIVVGGDGSMLFAAQEYLENLGEVVFVGVNTGTLGFLMDYGDGELEGLVEDLERAWASMEVNRSGVIEFPMLEAKVGDRTMHAVNEVRIENPMRTQDVTVYLDGQKFEELRSSGLCVATQLGSTAYNRSLGGAILEEGLSALILSEIAGIHHPKYKSLGVPYVMRDETEIRIVSEDYEGAYLGVDSTGLQLRGGGEVIIRKAGRAFRVLRMREIGHFERLGRLL